MTGVKVVCSASVLTQALSIAACSPYSRAGLLFGTARRVKPLASRTDEGGDEPESTIEIGLHLFVEFPNGFFDKSNPKKLDVEGIRTTIAQNSQTTRQVLVGWFRARSNTEDFLSVQEMSTHSALCGSRGEFDHTSSSQVSDLPLMFLLVSSSRTLNSYDRIHTLDYSVHFKRKETASAPHPQLFERLPLAISNMNQGSEKEYSSFAFTSCLPPMPPSSDSSNLIPSSRKGLARQRGSQTFEPDPFQTHGDHGNTSETTIECGLNRSGTMDGDKISESREKSYRLQREVLQALEQHVHETLAAAVGLTETCKAWAVKVGQAERELADLECGWMAAQDERQRHEQKKVQRQISKARKNLCQPPEDALRHEFRKYDQDLKEHLSGFYEKLREAGGPSLEKTVSASFSGQLDKRKYSHTGPGHGVDEDFSQGSVDSGISRSRRAVNPPSPSREWRASESLEHAWGGDSDAQQDSSFDETVSENTLGRPAKRTKLATSSPSRLGNNDAAQFEDSQHSVSPLAYSQSQEY